LQFEQVHKLGSNCCIEMGHSFCSRDVNNKTKSNGGGYHETSVFKEFYCWNPQQSSVTTQELHQIGGLEM
jgi:hypothetical protein